MPALCSADDLTIRALLYVDVERLEFIRYVEINQSTVLQIPPYTMYGTTAALALLEYSNVSKYNIQEFILIC